MREGKGESWEAPHRAQALENRVDSHGRGEELPPFELLIAAGLAELRAHDCTAGEPFSACLRSASRSVPDPASSGVDAVIEKTQLQGVLKRCLLYTSPSPRDQRGSRMPSSA